MDRGQQQKQQHCQNDHNHLHHQQQNQQQQQQSHQQQQQQQNQHFHRRPPDVEEALSSMLWTPYQHTPTDSSSSSDEDEKLNKNLLKKYKNNNSNNNNNNNYYGKTTAFNTNNSNTTYYNILYNNYNFLQPTPTTTNNFLTTTSNSVALTHYVPSIYRNKNLNRYDNFISNNNNNNNNRIISDNNSNSINNNNRFNFPLYNGHNISPIRIDYNEPPSYESLYKNSNFQISNSQITQNLSTVNQRQHFNDTNNDDDSKNDILPRTDRTKEIRMVHSFTDDFITTHQENLEQSLPTEPSSSSISNIINKNLDENIEQTNNNLQNHLKTDLLSKNLLVHKNSFSLLKNESNDNQFNIIKTNELNFIQGKEKIDHHHKQQKQNNQNYNEKDQFVYDENKNDDEITKFLVNSKIINQLKQENYIESNNNNNNNDFTIKDQNEPFLPKLLQQQQQQHEQQQKSTKVSKPSDIEKIYGNDLPAQTTANLLTTLNTQQQQLENEKRNNKATPQATLTQTTSSMNVERAAQTEPVSIINNTVGQFSREKEVVTYSCITGSSGFNTLSVRDLSSSIKLLFNTQSLLQKRFFFTLNKNSTIPTINRNNNSNVSLSSSLNPGHENIENYKFINVDNNQIKNKNNIVKFNDVENEEDEKNETISESRNDYDNNKVGVFNKIHKNHKITTTDNSYFNVVVFDREKTNNNYNQIEEKINSEELAMRLNVPGATISSSSPATIENQLNDEKFNEKIYTMSSEEMATSKKTTNINNKIPKNITTSSIFLSANNNVEIPQNVSTQKIATTSTTTDFSEGHQTMTILTPSLGAILSTKTQPSLTIQVNQNSNSYSNILTNNNNSNSTDTFLISNKNNIILNNNNNNNNVIESNQILSLPTPISGVNVINCYNNNPTNTVPNNNSLKNFINNSTNISSCANNLNSYNKNVSIPSGSSDNNDNRDLNRVQNNNVIMSTTLCNIDSNNDNNHLNINLNKNINNNIKNKNGLPVSTSPTIIPKLSTPERQFTSTECQTDDIPIDQLTFNNTSTPTRNPNPLNTLSNNNNNNSISNIVNNNINNNTNSNSSQTTDALIAREQRRRERRERRLQHNRNNRPPNHPHPHPHILSSPPNHHPPPPPIHHYPNPAAVNAVGMIRPMLPDILHSHFPPPYTTLSMSNPHHPGAINVGGVGSPPPGLPSRHPQQPPPPSALIAGPIISAVPLAAAATAVNDGRFTIPLPVIRRSPSERSGKGCCGQWFAGPPLRALIAVVALGGVACALGGAALGATGLAGPPTSHLTAALLMIGVGVILVTVSGAAWRMTAPGGPPCLGLSSTVDLGRCGRRPCSSRGGATHGLLYPEFQHRPPPPSYQASMQEYRLRLLLLDRDRQNGVVRGGSPPPTYRSHAGSLLRTPLTTNTRTGNGSRNYPSSIGCPGSEYSLPPSYNSRNPNNITTSSSTTTTTATINNNSLGTATTTTATTTIPQQTAIILRDDDSINSNNLLENNSNETITSALITSAPESLTLTNNNKTDSNQNNTIMSIESKQKTSSTVTNFIKNSTVESITISDDINTGAQHQKMNDEKFNPRVLANSNKNKNHNNFVIFGSNVKTHNQKDDNNVNVKNGNNRKKELVTIVTISASQEPEESSTIQSSEMEILAHL